MVEPDKPGPSNPTRDVHWHVALLCLANSERGIRPRAAGRCRACKPGPSNPTRDVHWHVALLRQIKKPLAGHFYLAEEVGFEPTLGLPLNQISSLAHSTTLPPLLLKRPVKRARILSEGPGINKSIPPACAHATPKALHMRCVSYLKVLASRWRRAGVAIDTATMRPAKCGRTIRPDSKSPHPQRTP